MEYFLLVVWLPLGVVGFWLARASWHWHFGCRPITVGTIIAMLFVMWLPPFSFLAAVVWAVMHMANGGVFRFLDYELSNPCKWFHKERDR